MSIKQVMRHIGCSIHLRAVAGGVLFVILALAIGRSMIVDATPNIMLAPPPFCGQQVASDSATPKYLPESDAIARLSPAESYACEGYATVIHNSSSSMMLLALSIIGASYVLITHKRRNMQQSLLIYFAAVCVCCVSAIYIYYRVSLDLALSLFVGRVDSAALEQQLPRQGFLLAVALALMVAQAIARGLRR